MLNPYSYKKSEDFYYEFVTEAGVAYNVYFLDYSAMFSDYPEISDFIYTINIDVISGDEKTTLTDNRIADTVISILEKFFNKIYNVIVYICDTADERHYARKRKFDYWFWKYNNGWIIKEDNIAVVAGVEIINSLLIDRRNPKLLEVILAFKDLNSKSNNK